MSTVGIDLRSPSKASVANDPSPGYGLFVDSRTLFLGQWEWDAVNSLWIAPSSVSGYTNMGADPGARMTLTQRNALEDVMGVSRGTLPAANLGQVLAQHVFGRLADSSGTAGPKPLGFTGKTLSLRLGSFGEVWREPFDPSSDNFTMFTETHRADYTRLANSGISQTLLEKVTGYLMLKYHGRLNSRLLSLYVPASFISAGHSFRRPTTTLGDTFVEVSDTNIESHTPTGPNAGTGWALVIGSAGDLVVLGGSNTVQRQSAVSNEASTARMTDALSSDDHYAQAPGTNTANGGGFGRFTGVATRVSNSAATFYVGAFHRAAADVADPYTISKFVAGTRTELGTVSPGDGDSPADNILKLSVNGSDLDLYAIDGTELQLSITDTAITGNLFTGISGAQTGANRNFWGTFEAADVTPAVIKYTSLGQDKSGFNSARGYVPA